MIQIFPSWEYFHFFDIHVKSSYLWGSNCNLTVNQVQLLTSDPRTGYMTLSGMTSLQLMKNYTSINYHRKDLETLASYCICLVMTHRLICIITCLDYLSGQVICPDLRLNFQNALSGQNEIVLMRLNATNTMVFRVFSNFFFVPKFLAKTLISPKKKKFLFDLPWKGQKAVST